MIRVLAMVLLIAIGSTAAPAGGAFAQGAGVTWLIFTDDLHLDFVNTGHIRKLLSSIARELIGEGDSFAMRSSGAALRVELTTNRALLDAALPKFSGMALNAAAILQSPAPDPLEEVRYRASLAGAAATEMLKVVTPLSRRRAVMLYVSNGYLVDPTGELVAGLARAAQQSSVTIFALNPRGLPGAQALNVRGDAALWARYQAAMLNSLRAIAEPTGGFAVLNAADFADAIPRIARAVR
jgi:hypothetical protein